MPKNQAIKKLRKIIRFSGTIELIDGLAIKGAGTDLGIGGADSEVIKNPLNNEPYIPGSSLKGKMRSQLEKKYGAFIFDKRSGAYVEDTQGSPCRCGRTSCRVCTVFGAHFNPGADSAPTRIIVRDAHMTEKFRSQIQELPPERGSYLELKGENIINRQNGTAEHPRFIERVPAGGSFDFEILLQILEGDDAQSLKGFVEEGLRLVESSYLGGSGSRGYGHVKFDYKVTEEPVAGEVVRP